MHAVKAQDISAKADKKTEQFIVLTISGERLVLPRSEMLSFEDVGKVKKNKVPSDSVGKMEFEGGEINVYALSADFSLQSQIPESQTVIVVLKNINSFGLLCDGMSLLAYEDYNIQEMPECLSTINTPVKSFCVYVNKSKETTVGMLTSAECIEKYIANYK